MRKERKKTKIQHAEIVKLFASRLRELRLARGMTQHELARLAGVAMTYVGRLENQESSPSIDTAQKLAVALGSTVHDLLPLTASADEVSVLRDQIRRQVDSVLQTDDRQTLGLLAQLLARITATTSLKS
jgi:transcriptional regulator with XRE-family HTH domain